MVSCSPGISGKAWKNLLAKHGNPEIVLTWSGNQGCDLKQNQILIDRNLVEAVARRIIVLDAANRKGNGMSPTYSGWTWQTMALYCH